MNNFNSTSFRLLAVAFATATLAACAGEGAYFPERTGYVETPPRSETSVTGLDHTIQLSPGQSALAPGQISQLNEFLALSGRTDGDHIEIRTRLANGNGKSLPGNVAIAADLQRSFVRSGYTSSHVHTINDFSNGNQITISIRRYEVMLPDCSSEWIDESSRNEPTGVRSLGCSNERNLGLMIADPRDLTGERDLSPANSHNPIEAVKRYQTDSVKDPGGSDGGGGQGIAIQAP